MAVSVAHRAFVGRIHDTEGYKFRINANTDNTLTLTEPFGPLFVLLREIGGEGACA
jgi:hypothetical protein